MGAVAAHLPAERFGLETGRAVTQSAVEMQMWHALALLALGLGLRQPSPAIQLAGCGLMAGTVIFCGTLYATAFSGHHFGSLAPTGGSLLIFSWLLLAVAFLLGRRQST